MTAGILEFFLGNTFPFIVFMTYGTSPHPLSPSLVERLLD